MYIENHTYSIDTKQKVWSVFDISTYSIILYNTPITQNDRHSFYNTFLQAPALLFRVMYVIQYMYM